eukprot:Em0006g367a
MDILKLVVLLLIYMFDFTGSSTQSLPCHTARGDNCTSSICPNTVVNYTCTISGTAAGNTDWTLPTGTCPTNAFPDKIRLSQFVSQQCVAMGSGVPMNITAAMNGSTVMCNNTNLVNTAITTIVSMATINVIGPPGRPNAVANTIDADMVLVVVNPSSSGGLPTNYSVTISNSSYVYSNSTPAFLNGSAMVTFTGLTIGTSYTISAVAINCAGSSNPTIIYVSCMYKQLTHGMGHGSLGPFSCLASRLATRSNKPESLVMPNNSEPPMHAVATNLVALDAGPAPTLLTSSASNTLPSNVTARTTISTAEANNIDIIAGIVIGGLVFLILFIVAVVLLICLCSSSKTSTMNKIGGHPVVEEIDLNIAMMPPPCDPIATPQASSVPAKESLYDASTQDQRVPEESLYDGGVGPAGNVPTGRGGNVQEAVYSQPDTSKKNANEVFAKTGPLSRYLQSVNMDYAKALALIDSVIASLEGMRSAPQDIIRIMERSVQDSSNIQWRTKTKSSNMPHHGRCINEKAI